MSNPGFRAVDQAVHRPNRCALLPYLGNTNASGFIDTNQRLDLEHVYVSFEAAAELAKFIGWTPPSVSRELRQEITALKVKVEQLEAELIEEKRLNDSIEFLGTKDFIARQKRGPKKKEQQESTTKAAL